MSKSDVSFGRILRLAMETGQIALGQGAGVLGAIVGVRLLTGVLSPAQYGEVALGATAGNLVSQLSLVPLHQSALRFFGPARETRELRACLAATSTLAGRASKTVAIVGAVVVTGLLLSGYGAWVGLAVAALALSFLSGLERILDALQNAGRQRAVTAWHQGLAQWLRPLLALGLIAWFGASSSLALLGYALATALVLASQFAFFRSRWWPVVSSEPLQPEAVDKWRSRFEDYARPFATWGAFMWVQQSSDRWALQTFSTTRDVGYYSVLYQLGYGPIILATGIIVQLVQPIFFNQSGDGTDPVRVTAAKRLNRRLLGVFGALTVVGVLVAQGIHRQVFSLLVAPDYRGVSWLMPWMLLSGGLFACGELAGLTLMIGLQTEKLRGIKIGSSLVGIGLNIISAYWLGLRGVVFASVGFSFVGLVLTFWASLTLPPTIQRPEETLLAAQSLAEVRS